MRFSRDSEFRKLTCTPPLGTAFRLNLRLGRPLLRLCNFFATASLLLDSGPNARLSLLRFRGRLTLDTGPFRRRRRFVFVFVGFGVGFGLRGRRSEPCILFERCLSCCLHDFVFRRALGPVFLRTEIATEQFAVRNLGSMSDWMTSCRFGNKTRSTHLEFNEAILADARSSPRLWTQQIQL